MKNIRSNNESQLLLLTGITLALSIITLSTISANLTSMDLSVNPSSSLREDYDNIRTQMGVALNDNLKGKIDLQTEEDRDAIAEPYFENIREIFIFYAETYNGNNFDAELTKVNKNSVEVKLTLSNNKQSIVETITYYM